MSDIVDKFRNKLRVVSQADQLEAADIIESLRAQVETLQSENARLKAMPLASDSVRAVIYGETIDKLGVQIAGNISEIVDLTKQNALLTLQLEEVSTVCAEAYQVVGSLLSDVGEFDSERGIKILDNLSQQKLVHADVLPWVSMHTEREE